MADICLSFKWTIAADLLIIANDLINVDLPPALGPVIQAFLGLDNPNLILLVIVLVLRIG